MTSSAAAAAAAAAAATAVYTDPNTLSAAELRRILARNEASQERIIRDQASRPPLWLFAPGSVDPQKVLEAEFDEDEETRLIMGPFVAEGLPKSTPDAVVANTGDWWYTVYMLKGVYADCGSQDSTCPAEEDFLPIRYDLEETRIEWTADFGDGDSPYLIPVSGLKYKNTLFASIEELVAQNAATLNNLAEDVERKRAYAVEEQGLRALKERETQMRELLLRLSITLDLVLVSDKQQVRHVDSRSIPGTMLDEPERFTVRDFVEHLGLFEPQKALVFYGDFVRMDLNASISYMLSMLRCQKREPPRLQIIHASRPEGDESTPTRQGKKRRSALACAMGKTKFDMTDADSAAEELNVDTTVVSVQRLLVGMNVELEHGDTSADSRFNVTNGDPIRTAQIALAHFAEQPGNANPHIPDYYELLEGVETEGDATWEELKLSKPSVFMKA